MLALELETGEAPRSVTFFCVCFHVYSGSEVREVFKKLLGGRGFVLTEYEPVGRHGDPVRVPGHWFWNMQATWILRFRDSENLKF